MTQVVPDTLGERYHWYSSTGWVMWNAQLAGLMSGTTCVIYDGSPGGPKDAPDWSVLWRFAARHRVTFFGAGAAFYANCMKAGVDLAACGDLSRIWAIGSTGSPLAADVQAWAPSSSSASAAGRCKTTSRRRAVPRRLRAPRGAAQQAKPWSVGATFGGATFQAARIFAAPSSAATASCRSSPA